ncbi:MAG TPA: bifunctional (p)ppGpp synthetase/guanosine-3',5'-bis(diphosphate) 3'-pyrophosphohydrolase [Candidatus Jorgensenbacteria bacterium]|nr:bifunctional (p)ppGpp synthetase/guanosine-3',5'-bis(diphosphate) 3'-pyrophosphohydrolase [Candidatus Jorgensenbacteria bacterium]
MFKLTPEIQKAINTSAVLHKNQERRNGGYPYVVHPFSVAVILSNYTDDEDIIIAGLLHDILEDVPEYTKEKMVKEFGQRVTNIVEGVTITDSLKQYIENLRRAEEGSFFVAAADKIHNIQSLIDYHKIEGDAMWKKFHQPKDKKLLYYEELLLVLKQGLDNDIVNEYENMLKNNKDIFK